MKQVLALALLSLLAHTATANELRRQGDAYDADYRAAEALKCYLEVEKTDGADADLKVRIARQYIFRMNNLKADSAKIESAQTALRYAEGAVKLDPNSSDAYLSVAICLGKLTPLLGNREMIAASQRIKSAAEKAIQLNSKSDYAWHLLGRWHQGVAGIGGVTRALASVIYGTMPKGSNEEAIRCFKKALEINPGRLIHHIELGRTYAAAGNAEQAKLNINKGLTMPNVEFDDPETKERGKTALKGL